MTNYSYKDAAMIDHIQNALVELPSFGMAKESKFQHLMQQNIDTTHSSLSEASSYNLDTNLSVDAKAFQPSQGNPVMIQSSSGTVEMFDNLSLSSSKERAGTRGNQPNPSANEFIPRNLSAPLLNQQNLTEFIPNRASMTQQVNRPAPLEQGASFKDSSAPRMPHQNQSNDYNSGLQMSTSIHGAAMDPRLPSSTVFAASQSNSSFYTPPSGSSSSFVRKRLAGRDLRSSFRMIEDYVQRLLSKKDRKSLDEGYNGSAASFSQQPVEPLSSNAPPPERNSPLLIRRIAGQNLTSSMNTTPTAITLNSSRVDPSITQHRRDSPYIGQPPLGQENRGTTYFCSQKNNDQSASVIFPAFHLYPGPPPSVEYMNVKANAPSFFMPTEVREAIMRKHALTMMTVDVEQDPSIPAEVDNYHSLFPLETPSDHSSLRKSGTFGYVTSCFKAIKYKDGLPYCLRRIHGFRQVSEKCITLVDMWKKLQHANIVQLRELFTSNAFGEHSLIFAHDYHACAETMMARHFKNPANTYASKAKWNGGTTRQNAGLLPESLIWIYIVQLTSALRCIHSAGLACRVLDLSKVIITDKSRIRINGVGIFDVLRYDGSNTNPRAHMQQYQQEDMIALGKIVLALASNSLTSCKPENVTKSVELVIKNYSNDLKNLLMYLLTPQQRPHSVNDIMPMIGARFYTHLDSAMLRGDVIENELSKELENGRLFRMICKLGIINERPEFSMELDWSETGDRYLLKLFRDHLFHQVTDTGSPWVDLSHVVQCLNKLDAGVPEKICLMSRDQQNILVVSYAELKKAYSKCYDEVAHPSAIM